MRRLIPFLCLLAACSATTETEVASPSAETSVVDLAFCKGESFADTVGQPVSTIQADLPERSRVLGPDDIATQDYRIDRLNVYVSSTGIIQDLTCG